MRGLTGILFSLRCVVMRSGGFESEGVEELVKIVGDFLIQAVELGSFVRREFAVRSVRLEQPGSQWAVDALEEFEKEQAN